MESIFRTLTPEEEEDFRSFVYTDEEAIKIIGKIKTWHPVIRDEIIKIIRE